MSFNNKVSMNPTRQICKRLTQKMKLKNILNQRKKVLNRK